MMGISGEIMPNRFKSIRELYAQAILTPPADTAQGTPAGVSPLTRTGCISQNTRREASSMSSLYPFFRGTDLNPAGWKDHAKAGH